MRFEVFPCSFFMFNNSIGLSLEVLKFIGKIIVAVLSSSVKTKRKASCLKSTIKIFLVYYTVFGLLRRALQTEKYPLNARKITQFG